MNATGPALTRPRICLIAAVARNGVIGDGDRLVWRLPEDLQHLRRTTMGAPVLMGRRTWDSLPTKFRPLPGRRNLVLTRQPGWSAEGAEVVSTLDEAIAHVQGVPRLFVLGGAQVYALAMARADELLLTEIDRDFAGDTRFPPRPAEFVEVAREAHHAAPPNQFDFSFVSYQRIP